MRLACSTSSFPAEPLGRAVARAAWAGFSAVELAPEGGEAGAAGDVGELRDRFQRNEVELAAVDAGCLGAAGAEGALAAAGRIGQCALLAGQLDGSRIVVSAPADGEVEHLAAGLATLQKMLAAVPVRVCLLNRAESLVATPAAAREVERRVETGSLEFGLDPAAALLAGWEPAAALERLPEPLVCVILNDAAGGRVVPPGEGEVDWPALMRGLRERGFSGLLTLRLRGADPWAVEPAACQARSLAEEWMQG